MTAPETASLVPAYTSATVGRWKLADKPLLFSTRIPAGLQERVRRHAAESGVSINDVVQRALEHHLVRVGRTAPIPRPKIIRQKKGAAPVARPTLTRKKGTKR